MPTKIQLGLTNHFWSAARQYAVDRGRYVDTLCRYLTFNMLPVQILISQPLCLKKIRSLRKTLQSVQVYVWQGNTLMNLLLFLNMTNWSNMVRCTLLKYTFNSKRSVFFHLLPRPTSLPNVSETRCFPQYQSKQFLFANQSGSMQISACMTHHYVRRGKRIKARCLRSSLAFWNQGCNLGGCCSDHGCLLFF